MLANISVGASRPLSLLRRIALAKSPGTSSGWIGRIGRTLAKGPKRSTREVADCKPTDTPAKKGALSVIKEKCPVKDEVHSPTTQQTKRITSPSSTSTQVRPVAKLTLSDKESRPGQPEPKTRIVVDIYNSRRQIADGKKQRLAEIADSIPTRRFWSARSMPRQGGPLQPIDPKRTVS